MTLSGRKRYQLRGRLFGVLKSRLARLAFAFLIAIAYAGVSPTRSAEVTVTRLDGRSLSGELRTWSTSDLVVATDQGDQTVPRDQLLSVRFAPAAPAENAAERGAFVELVDGTRIPISGFLVAGSTATIALPPFAAVAQAEITLPVRFVLAAGLEPLSPQTATQWDEVRALNLASDVLVIFKRGRENLDYVEGVLGDISADKVDFKLDGESTRADRSLAAGVLYFRRESPAAEDPQCVVFGKSGLKAVLAGVSGEGDRLRLKTISGAEFTWPRADVTLADYSAGKVAYLSNLEPATQTWTPLVALPASAKAAGTYGKPRRDQSPFGGPLTLVSPHDPATNQRRRVRQFDKGLAIRSRTELAYRLPAGYRRFVAVAGIDPQAAANGNVKLTISGDNRELFAGDIGGNDPPATIDIDIANVRRLSVAVDYGRNLDSGDWLILGDARIVK